MGFLCTRLLGSLSISPLSSYSDLLRLGALGMSCSSLSHIATLLSQLVSSFSSTPIHHSSYPFFVFFYPHQSSSRFMNDMFFGTHHLSLDIVHADVRVRHFTHMVLRYLTLHTQRLGIIYWAFVSLFPIVSFTFYPYPSLRSES